MRDEKRYIRQIIRAYDNPIVRAYCLVRFHILNQRFLFEIGQYLPANGTVLDIGCGFGLFSLYYAKLHPELNIVGIDRNAGRVEQATRAAARLGVTTVRYEVGDVTDYALAGQFDAAYMLDIVHHIPKQEVQPLVARVSETLARGGTLLIKDIDSKPAYKRWFTWALDKLMDPEAQVNYWPARELRALLQRQSFQVFHHEVRDYLPYPHILYICRQQPVTATLKPSRSLAIHARA